MDEQTTQIQNQPERQLTKRERRELRREEKARQAEQAKKASGRKNMFIWVVIIAIVGAGGFGIWTYLSSQDEGVEFDVTNACVNHIGTGMHIHPDLSIEINNDRVDIPANIGISPGCMRPLHTHDTTGRLHIEFSRQRNFTLGEFFKVWDKPFSGTKILNYATDETHELVMKVNGEVNTEYENFVLRDHDRIEIQYKVISE